MDYYDNKSINRHTEKINEWLNGKTPEIKKTELDKVNKLENENEFITYIKENIDSTYTGAGGRRRSSKKRATQRKQKRRQRRASRRAY
jgi:hypothetical protein